MKELNRSTYTDHVEKTERIIQFGEGNFLRAFCDWIIQKLNRNTDFNSSVVIVQPIERGMVDLLNKQDGLYNLILQGREKGKNIQKIEVIDSVSRGVNPYKEFNEYLELARSENFRFVISNTTEAGIAIDDADDFSDTPPKSFPAKVTRLLYESFKYFSGDISKGFIFIPCELIDNNGSSLFNTIKATAEKWNLEADFIEWIDKSCRFYNTLVDRIVPGFPADKKNDYWEKIGYEDNLLVEGELFHFWVLEGSKDILNEIPFDKVDLNIRIVDDQQPYRTRKVRILNGAHTAMVPTAYLCGLTTVGETLNDSMMMEYVKRLIFEEVIPTIDLPQNELKDFAEAVIERFENPYVKHRLMDISLNSISKYKTRILPTVLDYQKLNNKLPDILVFALASLICFYKGVNEEGENIALNDDPDVLSFFKELWKYEQDLKAVAEKVLGNDKFWGINLNEVPGMSGKIKANLQLIKEQGMKNALKKLLGR